MTSDPLTIFPKQQVLTAADGQAYQAAIRRWADNAQKNAKFVILPESASDVSKAILFAVDNKLDLAIKGGGHSCSGASSSNGLVIDLSRLNSVTVDPEKRLIKVGGGALWEAVDQEAAKHNLAIVGGTVNHTGVGGLTVGGGYGWLTPKYGLTIDNLVQAEVVLANGSIVECSDSTNSDLFWAIRGAGSNFGPVTSFTFRAYPQTNAVWSGLLVFTPAQLAPLVAAITSWSHTASEDESGMMFIASPPPHFKPCLVFIPFFNGPADQGKAKFKALYDVGPVADMTQEMPYEALNGIQNPMATFGDRKLFKASALLTLDPAQVGQLLHEYGKLTEKYPETGASAIIFEFHGYKKLMSVPSSATAFANRGPWFNININLRWKDATLDGNMRKWAASMVEYLKESQAGDLSGTRGYSNYGLGDERTRDVFGENYDRLAELKGKYDPGSVFNKWFPITPRA